MMMIDYNIKDKEWAKEPAMAGAMTDEALDKWNHEMTPWMRNMSTYGALLLCVRFYELGRAGSECFGARDLHSVIAEVLEECDKIKDERGIIEDDTFILRLDLRDLLSVI